MKISNSKKELARIISENGGWREMAKFSAQDKDGDVYHFATKPTINAGHEAWHHKGCIGEGEFTAETLPNWHQTILSREEYFHLYPAPDADGWIEWKGGECPVGGDVIVACKVRTGKEFRNGKKIKASILRWRHTGGVADIIAYRLHKPEQAYATDKLSSEAVSAAKIALMSDSIEELARKPTIEQLASDYQAKLDIATRSQEEADAHRCGAEVALSKLEIAAKELGFRIELVTAKQEPELVISVQVGDDVGCIKSNVNPNKYRGMIGTVLEVDDTSTPYLVDFGGEAKIWCHEVKFIRRP